MVQSTFSGLRQVAKTNNLIELANTLNNYATPALNEYARFKGQEITEETDREAELKARSTSAKSYADAVANGELDGTQSPYWQSVYDNVKGKNHGIEFGIKKQNALNEWIQNNIAEDSSWEDKDGSQFFQWSSEYDVNYFKDTLNKQSKFFKKGLDGLVGQTNANLGQSYTAYIKERQHTLLKNNLENIILSAIDSDIKSVAIDGNTEGTGILSVENLYRAITTEGTNAKLLAGLKGDEFNTIVLSAAQSAIAKYAIVGDKNANFDMALSILDKIEKYKRPNGSNLFNSESKKQWADLKQTILSEQDRHEAFLEQERKEILQFDFVTNQIKLLKNSFTGGNLAGFDPQAQEKADFAEDAYKQIMLDWVRKNNPDLDTDEGLLSMKRYADDVRGALEGYYKIRYGEDVKIFDLNAFKQKHESQRIANIPLQFTSLEEAELQIQIFNENGTGLIREIMDLYLIEDPRTLFAQQQQLMIKQGWLKMPNIDKGKD